MTAYLFAALSAPALALFVTCPPYFGDAQVTIESYGVAATAVHATTAEDLEARHTLLRALHPSGFRDLRAFRAARRGDPPRVASFAATDLAAVDSFARENADRDIYHGVAPRIDAKRRSGDSCSALSALFAEIDFKDVPEADARARIAAFALPPSAVVSSGGGLHLYWLLETPLDLRNGGFDAARSLLRTLATTLGADLAAAEPARILRLPGTLNHKYTPARVVAIEKLSDSRYSVDTIAAALPIAETPEPSDEPAPAAVSLAVEERKRRARRRLDLVPPAIEGQHGDQHTFRTVCTIVRGFDLTDDDAFEVLTPWSARCQPAWTPSELRAKIRNARKHGKEAIGSRLEFPYTEIGDAETFAAKYGDRARYDHRLLRWVVTSDTGIWIPDPVEMLRGWVVQTMRERQQRAAALPDIDERRRAFKWALQGESSGRVTSTLREARAMPPIADDGDNWDPNPMLLGGPTGVVDLADGTLRSATPEDRVTMRTRATFDPLATCPLWNTTIAEVFGHDRELIEYVQRALGYSLTGDCREECFFVAHGVGGNGKGTVMNTVAWVLGDYADDLPFSALERMDRSSIPADIAKLPGKRFVTASESGETAQLNEARIKALTGRDPITARLLHRNFFTFQPVAKFWLATNAKPVVKDDSDGFWRRVHLIPFTQSFVGRADKTLKDRLRDEGSGILSWLVVGALAWQREGLNPPPVVLAATEEYRRENEPLAPFLEARCVIADKARVQASILFAAYRTWCDEFRIRDAERLNQTTFGKQMRKRFTADEGRHVEYVGVGLRDDQREQSEF